MQLARCVQNGPAYTTTGVMAGLDPAIHAIATLADVPGEISLISLGVAGSSPLASGTICA
jgi:hypothetical protein